jgi:hypothetical protein
VRANSMASLWTSRMCEGDSPSSSVAASVMELMGGVRSDQDEDGDWVHSMRGAPDSPLQIPVHASSSGTASERTTQPQWTTQPQAVGESRAGRRVSVVAEGDPLLAQLEAASMLGVGSRADTASVSSSGGEPAILHPSYRPAADPAQPFTWSAVSRSGREILKNGGTQVWSTEAKQPSRRVSTFGVDGDTPRDFAEEKDSPRSSAGSPGPPGEWG